VVYKKPSCTQRREREAARRLGEEPVRSSVAAEKRELMRTERKYQPIDLTVSRSRDGAEFAIPEVEKMSTEKEGLNSKGTFWSRSYGHS